MIVISRLARALRSRIGIELIGLRPRPRYRGEQQRFEYQSSFTHFTIRPDELVLDVGSGADPFPYSTVVVDRYVETTVHRAAALNTAGKPFLIADIHALPFQNKSFDFVFCSHVLEHVDDPALACQELVRVGRRGYIETPALLTDAMFAWAAGMHRWFTIAIGNRIVFFEYDDRRSEGIRSDYWTTSIFARRHHPLQSLFYDNLDIFYNFLSWNDHFHYSVFYLDGRTEHSA